MVLINYNERSWAIDVISEINLWANKNNLIIKRAGGEVTINSGKINFPDILLYGDFDSAIILQGWELKMPDTDIHDKLLINDAYNKAKKLNLNTFLVWNVNNALLFKIYESGSYKIIKEWNIIDSCKRDNVNDNKVYWKKLLYEILNDICYYFENKIIKPTKIIDSISAEFISNIILTNYKNVSRNINKECNVNINLSDEINIWWFSIKNEYENKANKYDVLAKLILTSWINKFIFANLLKKNHQYANKINEITNQISVFEAIDIIDAISNCCDFKNIFQHQLAEFCIPDITWSVLIDFNNFLINNRLEKLDKNTIQILLKRIVKNSKRKLYGQYPTPYNLALFLTCLVILDKTKIVFDPCCGTGTIMNAVYDLKNKSLDKMNVMDDLWASDKFKFPLQLSMLSFVNPSNVEDIIHLFNDDVIDLYVNKPINFFNPISAKNDLIKLPSFDYILSNLPFIQQKDIEKFNSDVNIKINNKIQNLIDDDNLKLDSKSDLYMYIPFSLWDLLVDNGKIGLIISNSWLGTFSGQKFYQILNHFFHVEYIIISGCKKWFNDVDVITNILVLKKRVLLSSFEDDEVTNYVVLKEDINNCSFENIEYLSSLIRSNSKSNSFNNNIYSKHEENQLFSMGLSRNALFSNVKWLIEIKDKLVEANEFFEIKRGERRGWDDLFYPKNHEIEEVYIKKVILNSKKLKGYFVDNIEDDAFCCDKSLEELNELGHVGAINWIHKFENKVNGVGKLLPEVLSRSNMYWYTMKNDAIAEICISLNPDKRIFFSRLSKPCFVNQRLIRFIIVDDNLDSKLASALLNSILGLFFIEALGFGRALGVLDLNVTTLNKSLSILNYKLLTEENINNILNKYDLLEKRNVFDIKKELNQEDRKDFDFEVLSSFGIENYYKDIYNSLLELYDIRKSVEL